MGNNIATAENKKKALFGECSNSKSDCDEIKQYLLKGTQNSQNNNFKIIQNIWRSNELAAGQTNQNIDDISGCSMLLNHILVRQTKELGMI